MSKEDNEKVYERLKDFLIERKDGHYNEWFSAHEHIIDMENELKELRFKIEQLKAAAEILLNL